MSETQPSESQKIAKKWEILDTCTVQSAGLARNQEGKNVSVLSSLTFQIYVKYHNKILV